MTAELTQRGTVRDTREAHRSKIRKECSERGAGTLSLEDVMKQGDNKHLIYLWRRKSYGRMVGTLSRGSGGCGTNGDACIHKECSHSESSSPGVIRCSP